MSFLEEVRHLTPRPILQGVQPGQHSAVGIEPTSCHRRGFHQHPSPERMSSSLAATGCPALLTLVLVSRIFAHWRIRLRAIILIRVRSLNAVWFTQARRGSFVQHVNSLLFNGLVAPDHQFHAQAAHARYASPAYVVPTAAPVSRQTSAAQPGSVADHVPILSFFLHESTQSCSSRFRWSLR